MIASDDRFGFLSRFVEQTDVGRIPDVGRCARGVGDQLPVIRGRFGIILRLGVGFDFGL